PSGSFDLKHLRAIHRHLFQDVYDWAGELRTVEIFKGGSQFQFRQYIATGWPTCIAAWCGADISNDCLSVSLRAKLESSSAISTTFIHFAKATAGRRRSISSNWLSKPVIRS